MKVIVGSKNPVKIVSVKEAFEMVWPEKVWEVEGVEVDSGVSSQPMSNEEAVKGAKNRAIEALKKIQADFGVGLEGGLEQVDSHWFTHGWMAVVDKKGNLGLGSSIGMEIPKSWISKIKKGKELGEVEEEAFGIINNKQKAGYFGVMSNGHIDRTHGYLDGVVSALARFIKSGVF